MARKIGSVSSDVFERRTSTGSEVFSLLTCLDDIKFVFLSFFTVIEFEQNKGKSAALMICITVVRKM